jgi:hypothetical protein
MSAHLRQAVLAVISVLALAVVCAVAWTPRPRAEAPLPAPLHPPTVTVGSASDAGARPLPLPARNVFEFDDRGTEAPTPASLGPLTMPPPLDLAAPALAPADEPVRLVGFVRRGGVLRAALSLHGTVSVLGAGEEADGYSVLSVDEDAGVSVRTPDGDELRLPPSP